MRLGFFYGVSGDTGVLAQVRELLADCDHLVSLGDLLSDERRGDGDCLALALSSGAPGAKVTCLAGLAERKRAHDGALPAEWRLRLKGLPSSTVIDGVALHGSAGLASPMMREQRALAGRPQLHAPMTIAASQGATELWRASAGNTVRADWVADVQRLRPQERVRLELSAVEDEGVLRVAVLDSKAGTLELRERLHLSPAPAASGGGRPRVVGHGGALRRRAG